MKKIKNENYYIIHGWMLNELDLKGVQLQVYAIIYGFSQIEDNEFTGSLSYLCEFTGASKPTIIKALKDLQEKNLIARREENINSVTFTRYSAILPVVKKLYQGSKETLPGGGKETLPNNIIYNNINIKKERDTAEKIILGEFENVQMSQNDLNKLYEKWSKEQVDNMVENLSCYLASSRKRYKNHYAVLLTWLKKDFPTSNKKASAGSLIEEGWCKLC